MGFNSAFKGLKLLKKPRERAFKQFKWPRPQCVNLLYESMLWGHASLLKTWQGTLHVANGFPPFGATPVILSPATWRSTGFRCCCVPLSAEQSQLLATGCPSVFACLNSRYAGYIGMECIVNMPQNCCWPNIMIQTGQDCTSVWVRPDVFKCKLFVFSFLNLCCISLKPEITWVYECVVLYFVLQTRCVIAMCVAVPFFKAEQAEGSVPYRAVTMDET